MKGSILITLGSRFLSAGLNFFIVVMLSRVLGPEGKGICSLALSVIAIYLIFSNVAGGATLVYLVPRYPLSKLLPICYAWLLLTLCALYAVLQVYPVVDTRYHPHILGLSLLHGLVAINQNVLLGRQKPGQYNLVTIVQATVTFLVLLAAFYFAHRPTVMSYLVSLYAGFGAAVVVSQYLSGRTVQSTAFESDRPVLNEIFRLGFTNLLANAAQFLNYRIAFYILDHYSGHADVGIYSNGVSVAEAIWLLGNSISVVQYSRIANISENDASARLTARLARMNGVVTIGIALPFVFFGGMVYSWLFGSGFSQVGDVIRLLLPGVVAFSFNIICSNYFSGTGRYSVNTWASLTGLAVSVAGCYLLIPSLGIKGASLAATLSYTATTVVTIGWFVAESRLPLRDLVPGTGDLRAMLRAALGKG